MPFHLLITAGLELGLRIELPVGEIVIGRAEGCAVRLADPAVSREHCRLVVEPGFGEGDSLGDEAHAGASQQSSVCRLIDLHSRWGTRVNGEVVQECGLVPGDLIEIGNTVVRLELVSTPTDSTLERKPSPAKEPASGERSPTPLQRIQAAQWVGRTYYEFHLESVLANTPTGVVYRARDARGAGARFTEPRPAWMAVKLFHPHRFKGETDWRRFLRGVRLASSVQDEQLVRLIDAGREGGICFTASELVEGESAADLIQEIGVAGMLDWQ